LEQVFINGNSIPTEIPLRALFFGEGLFETFRYNNRMPLFFNMHYERMEAGARMLQIPLMDKDSVIELVKKAVIDSGLPDAYVKICVLSGGSLNYYDIPEKGDIAIIIRDYAVRKEPVRASVNSFKRSSESPIRRVKSLNYLENVMARREAGLSGYDESIFLNERGEITESTSGNIFWFNNDVLFTPSLGTGILPGITRAVLIKFMHELGLRVEEGGYRPEHLVGSSFAFLTNSLVGSVLLMQLGEIVFPLNDKLYEGVRKLLTAKLGWL
jgi:4-amino-4-deoxychorismate lyase